MAYRIKGIFTKKQREALEKFTQIYHTMLADEAVDAASKESARGVLQHWVLLFTWALYVDNYKMLEKVICKEAK